jgi:7,8-dihydro-6-hydroxymethylpterin-pyrophosphokinase
MKTIKTSPNEPESSQPFENFERLAKDLMAVPKKELDAKLAEYERQKGRKKKRQSKPKT